jgi:hypothetical protein
MASNEQQLGIERAVAALACDLPRIGMAEASARIARLRRQAVADGFLPTAMMADGLADALDRHGRAAPLQTWLDALATAAGFGKAGAELADVLLASVGVRFAA